MAFLLWPSISYPPPFQYILSDIGRFLYYNPKSDDCQLFIVSSHASLYNIFSISSGRSAVRPYRRCLGSPY